MPRLSSWSFWLWWAPISLPFNARQHRYHAEEAAGDRHDAC